MQLLPWANWESAIHSCFATPCLWEMRSSFFQEITQATLKGLLHLSQVLLRSRGSLPYRIWKESQNTSSHILVLLSCQGKALSQAANSQAAFSWFPISLSLPKNVMWKSVSSIVWSFCSTALDACTWSQCRSKKVCAQLQIIYTNLCCFFQNHKMRSTAIIRFQNLII